MNGTATKLGFSTYLNGTGETAFNSIAIDANDDPVLTGYTDCLDYPTTAGAYQETSGTASWVAVVTQMKANGTGLLYSTVFGGTNGNPGDYGELVAVGPTGNAFVAGSASSADFPTTPGAWQSLVDTNGEGFLACFSLTAGAGNTLTNFFLQPSVIAGQEAQGAVYLNGSAASTTAISLSGSGPATFPGTVQVAATTNSGQFTVNTQAVTTPTSFVITAKLAAVSLSRSIQVVPMAIKSLSVSPSPIIGGNTATAAITVSAFTGFGQSMEVQVTTTGPISSNSPQLFHYSSDYLDIPVYTKGVSQVSPASITVKMGGLSKTAMFTVYPTFETASLTSSTVVGGTNINGTVTTYLPVGASPRPIWIEPSSYIYVSGTDNFFYIQPGKTSGTFSIPTYAAPANTVVDLVVVSGVMSKTLPVTITPPPITSLTFNPSSSVAGGTQVGAYLTLGGEASYMGDVVSVASNSPSAVVPATVKVNPYSTTASFTINTKKVTVKTTVTITLKLGSTPYYSTLTLTP